MKVFQWKITFCFVVKDTPVSAVREIWAASKQQAVSTLQAEFPDYNLQILTVEKEV
jgi:hypothetical protein